MCMSEALIYFLFVNLAYALIPFGNINPLSVATPFIEPVEIIEEAQPGEEPSSSHVSNSATDENVVIESSFSVDEESTELENPLDYSMTSVPTEDIISTSAKLADICKCGPNKCKPDGKCCEGCPGMEDQYCHEERTDENNLTGETSERSYTISIPETNGNNANFVSVVDEESIVSLVDASCQTDEVQGVKEATQCGCSCVVLLNKDSLSVYKEYQHSKGECCIHSK